MINCDILAYIWIFKDIFDKLGNICIYSDKFGYFRMFKDILVYLWSYIMIYKEI